ncbi:hypothetical protein RUMCAL_03290 [Ruminococcus callidus ATCC 27760]|uniref:Uncharacterized protein n=1 Tax=Ruminococcus callidus ATCC 27760 TaxID=411473 RepID=U2LDH0_9FIRM|nr:hypothetical protein RUMCAL_03290 [Ruminococcus callidus ATCC 27760]
MPAEFLCNLPKNLTTHLTHKLCSVFLLCSVSAIVQRQYRTIFVRYCPRKTTTAGEPAQMMFVDVC